MLRAVRVVLNLAVRWGVIASAPKMTLLRGERQRDRVVTQEEEARYIAAAGEPLGSLATVLVDTGLRPEECFRLCWEDINFSGGRYSILRVLRGKTKAARRALPLSARVRDLLSTRCRFQPSPKCDMYDDSLVPIALVNKLVSLANHPSSRILQKFAKQAVSGATTA